MSEARVLLLGCGNIGFGYDRHTDFVKTHCKALSRRPHFSVSVYDADMSLAEAAAVQYGFAQIRSLNTDFSGYDRVVIATPTSTHESYLETAFRDRVPLVICEKPVCGNAESLKSLQETYKSSNTKVLVNYMRRFQPAFIELKQLIKERSDKPLHISVTYQRGLNNNFSHAADLLQFLFGSVNLSNISVFNSITDEIDQDPTMSFNATLNESIPLSVNGLAGAKFSYFDIEIFYADHKYHLANNAGDIFVYHTSSVAKPYQTLHAKRRVLAENILDNFMEPVYDYADRVEEGNATDNFLSSMQLNAALLNISNGQVGN